MTTVGILGCGKASTSYHLPVIEALDTVELQWVADVDEDRASATGREYDVRYYTDPSDAIADAPDVVHVNTPPFTHRDLTVQSLEAGAHVLVEKPMAMTGDECHEMIEAATRTGNELCVVHNNLFFPPMRDVLDSVDRGEFGDLLSVRSFLGGQPNPTEERDWAEETHGGLIGDRLPHPIYLVTHFVDDVEDLSVRTVENERGLVGVDLQVGGSSTFGSVHVRDDAIPAKTMSIAGTRKRAEVDLFNNVKAEYDTLERSNTAIVTDNLGAAFQISRDTVKSVVEYAHDTVTDGQKFAAPGHYELIDRFHRSVASDREPPVPAEEGLKVVEVLEAIEER